MLDGLEGVTDVVVRGTGVTLNSLDADATVRALVHSEIAFSDLEVTGAGLEEAFVALTECDQKPDAVGGPVSEADWHSRASKWPGCSAAGSSWPSPWASQ